jgi:hypothetical protein
MNVRAKVHGTAMPGEKRRARRKIIGIESVPKISGKIRKSLSGLGNG